MNFEYLVLVFSNIRIITQLCNVDQDLWLELSISGTSAPEGMSVVLQLSINWYISV